MSGVPESRQTNRCVRCEVGFSGVLSRGYDGCSNVGAEGLNCHLVSWKTTAMGDQGPNVQLNWRHGEGYSNHTGHIFTAYARALCEKTVSRIVELVRGLVPA